MKVSRRSRTVAAILVVVFLLTSLWAAYYVYSENSSSTAGSGEKLAATFVESAINGFTASLRPSVLYDNSTSISGGNVTLFTPITNWINVTLLFSVLANRTSAIALHSALTVDLSTAAWSKPLHTSDANASAGAAAGLALQQAYDVNVTSVVALATAIDAQLGYNAAVFVLSITPVITGTLTTAGVEQPIVSEPRFNLTFAGSLITPRGLTYSGNGSVYLPGSSTSVAPEVKDLGYLALAGSLVALGVSVWLVSRPLREGAIVPLDRVIAPYEEAIADTAAPPTDATTVPVAQFADLVKIADTLGKPILRPTSGDPTRPTFFVMDGTVAYSFRYPGGSSTSLSILERIQWEMIRLRSLALDETTATAVRHRLSHAIDLLRDGEDAQATQEVSEVSALLTGASKTGTSAKRPDAGRP